MFVQPSLRLWLVNVLQTGIFVREHASPLRDRNDHPIEIIARQLRHIAHQKRARQIIACERLPPRLHHVALYHAVIVLQTVDNRCCHILNLQNIRSIFAGIRVQNRRVRVSYSNMQIYFVPGQTILTNTPYGFSMQRRAGHYGDERELPSPKAKLAILVEEYIGLMKFIPSPATEDKMQI